MYSTKSWLCEGRMTYSASERKEIADKISWIQVENFSEPSAQILSYGIHCSTDFEKSGLYNSSVGMAFDSTKLPLKRTLAVCQIR